MNEQKPITYKLNTETRNQLKQIHAMLHMMHTSGDDTDKIFLAKAALMNIVDSATIIIDAEPDKE